jgi:hypothetical protein
VEWEVEYTDEFAAWWDSLTEDEQVDVNAKVILLQKTGPNLAHPHADVIRSSRHPNMKELRIQHAGRPYRILFAFDPRRFAILLIGGDKTGNIRWYEIFFPIADSYTTGTSKALRKKENSYGEELQESSSKNVSRSTRPQRKKGRENALGNGPRRTTRGDGPYARDAGRYTSTQTSFDLEDGTALRHVHQHIEQDHRGNGRRASDHCQHAERKSADSPIH